MTWQSYKGLAINPGSQPTALRIGVEISQTESQMVMGPGTWAAAVISIKEMGKQLRGTLGQPNHVSRKSTYKLGAEWRGGLISYVNVKWPLWLHTPPVQPMRIICCYLGTGWSDSCLNWNKFNIPTASYRPSGHHWNSRVCWNTPPRLVY